MALLLRASGEVVGIAPAAGSAFTLKELQTYVGGYIEAIRGPGQWSDRWLVMNEDGKRLQLPANYGATLLLREAGGRLDDIVVGDVVIASTAEMDGDDHDVAERES